MKYLIIIIALLSLGQGSMAQTHDTIKIMPLGDSNTEGYPQMQGGYRVQLWHRLLTEGLSVQMVGSMTDAFEWEQPRHEGHSGWTISDIDRHIVNWLNIYQPDVVLLMVGTNDILTDQYDLMRPRFEALVDKIYATKPDMQLIVATLLPIWGEPANTQVGLFNNALTSIVSSRAMEGKRITLVDMNTPFDANDLIDGVHPTGTAAQAMGDVWYGGVSKLLRDPFQQLSPVSGQTIQTEEVEFSWTQGARDETYTLKLRSVDGLYRFKRGNISSASCSDGICRITVDMTTTPFPYQAAIKWKVIGNERKTSWQFFSIKIPAPELFSPQENAQLQTLTPDFTWVLVPNAARYDLLIDRIDLPEKQRVVKVSFTGDSTPSIAEICNLPSPTCAVNLSTLNLSLPGDGLYRWRVKTEGTYGKSRSLRSTFTVKTQTSENTLIPLP